MALSLDSPVEDLGLSNRVRNVLHLSGLHTVASLLKCDYKTALRGFGLGARAELASALETKGFTPPASLNPSEIDDIAGDISKLFGQMEVSFQKWSARIEHFEMRIRELTARASSHQRRDRSAAEAADQSRAIAGAAPGTRVQEAVGGDLRRQRRSQGSHEIAPGTTKDGCTGGRRIGPAESLGGSPR
jgi:hypothetical protein